MISQKELIEEINNDSKIDFLNIRGEIERSIKLHAKYLTYHLEYKELMLRIQKEQRLKRIKRVEYYSGSADASVYRKKPFSIHMKNQKQLDEYLSSDEELVSLDIKYERVCELLFMIHEMINNLKYRNNHINTIFELNKFEAGE